MLVACEFSGIVRDAFIARGHDAWSCDLLPTERPGPHFQEDVLNVLGMRYTVKPWDLLIAHPPCDYITNSGVQWLHRTPKNPNPYVLYKTERWAALVRACRFFKSLLESSVNQIAVENPIPHKYAVGLIGRSYDQRIQPFSFGHGESKATCLWLKNLPPLMATELVAGRAQRVFHESPGPERKKNRSRTYQGIAEAMAQQWG